MRGIRSGSRGVWGPGPPLRERRDTMRVPKLSGRNNKKRSTRIDFTHQTFAEKGGGVSGNTHMRTLNNTEWGGLVIQVIPLPY